MRMEESFNLHCLENLKYSGFAGVEPVLYFFLRMLLFSPDCF